jgi:hypothetical protein
MNLEKAKADLAELEDIRRRLVTLAGPGELSSQHLADCAIHDLCLLCRDAAVVVFIEEQKLLNAKGFTPCP